MNDQTLPYLICLRETFHKLSTLQVDAVAQKHIAVSSRLLDFIIAQRTVSPKLKSEVYSAFLDLVPTLKTTLSEQADEKNVNVTLQKLQEIFIVSDLEALAQFLLHTA